MGNPHSAPAGEASAGVGAPGAPRSAGTFTATGRSPISGVAAGQLQEGNGDLAFDLPFCS